MRPDEEIVLASLVRAGCAAYGALPIPATDALSAMRRERALRIGAAFVDEIEARAAGVEVEANPREGRGREIRILLGDGSWTATTDPDLALALLRSTRQATA